MRPARLTAAHRTGWLAELVCSNSLKSEQEFSAPWLLKQELRQLDSLLLRVAGEVRVPAGHALAVDREVFARRVTEVLESLPGIEIRREEVTRLPSDGIVIVATGPLTAEPLAAEIARLTGSERLYFYDAISPIVYADSLDYSKIFRASRYGKSLEGGDDYLNCPLERVEYERFVDALLAAETVTPHIPEDHIRYFEACLPIEELARRGRDALRFGPMKPTGLVDPRTGRRPWAVVQLRQENLRADSYNLVGFQNHLRFGEQERLFRMIPGLERAEFVRFGQMHRNTYINAPALLAETLQLKQNSRTLFAGQIAGVEGYVEAIATGLLAGRNAARLAQGLPASAPPAETALGALCRYIAGADPHDYQPANMTFDLLPPLEEQARRRLAGDRRARHRELARRAREAFERWTASLERA